MPDLFQKLRTIMAAQRIASLGTLHDGEPYVSMVPIALLPAGTGFVMHVSRLAAHTKDMLADPRVSLLVMAPQSVEVPPPALPRVTVQGDAVQLPPESADHAAAKQAYLARFPQSAAIFDYGDFSLFLVRPRSIRIIGGFAEAKTLTPQGFAEALRG